MNVPDLFDFQNKIWTHNQLTWLLGLQIRITSSTLLKITGANSRWWDFSISITTFWSNNNYHNVPGICPAQTQAAHISSFEMCVFGLSLQWRLCALSWLHILPYLSLYFPSFLINLLYFKKKKKVWPIGYIDQMFPTTHVKITKIYFWYILGLLADYVRTEIKVFVLQQPNPVGSPVKQMVPQVMPKCPEHSHK